MHLTGEGLACERGERKLFQDVNFSLAPGDLLLLRGANGSGKSSFLRLLAGLLPASAGTIRVDDIPVAPDWQTLRPQLIYIGHLDPVKPAFSVAENLIFWMGLMGQELHYKRGRGGGLMTQGTERALQAMGIAALADIPARFLSSGQRRRLNLARLAAIQRPLWLLDEPMVGLDQVSGELLAGLIGDHRKSGGLIVAATHSDLGVTVSSDLHFGAGKNP
ncbi:MAG: heme ABC exporter ATP-binding protein CcmA [Alphaproteobacteria bacterium]